MSNITRIRLRRDTAANWTAANPVLGNGEVGIETDTRNFKVGNGSTAWAGLDYYLVDPPQPPEPEPLEPLVRGQASKMDTGTISISTQGTYVSTGLTGIFDTATANDIALGTTDTFAVKNVSGGTKLMEVYGSIDARTVTGNNKTLGVKLALNGVAISETECRAFTGTGTEEAKLVTKWMIEMDDDDEVALFIANHSDSGDISFRRGRLVAIEVRS